MHHIPLFGPPQSGHAYARARDARVEWLLESHPATAGMLVAIGWFPTKGKALRRLNRLAAKERIRLVGTVSRTGGRPEHVFCTWRPKGDDLLHEVLLTDLCLRLDAGQVLRGPQLLDDAIRPDAEVRINGRRFRIELDRGTMGLAQISKRFAAYEGCDDLVLWVCPTPLRRDALRRLGEPIRGVALFTTLPEVLASPHGEVWLDYGGTRAALPREKAADV